MNCSNNAFQHGDAVIDKDLASAATLSLYRDDLASQQSEYRITAVAPGTVFPAGSKPGIAVQLPVGDNVSYSATVATLLNGAQRESFAAVAGHTGASDGSLAYWGLPDTTMDFDSVQLTITETTPSLEQHVFEIIEFCADGAKL